MTVEVVPLAASREPDYAHFVAGHPGALISYTLAYRDLLVDLLGCEPHYAVALRDGLVVGVMPLMRCDGPCGAVLNSLPYFGSNGGPLIDDPEAGAALWDWYANQSHLDGVIAGTVVANPLAKPQAALTGELEDMRVGHITSLPRDGDAREQLWAAIDGSARRNVKKALRCGTRVTVDNDGFGILESLHRCSMEAIGAPVKQPEFFAAVPRHFRSGTDYELYVAHIDGQPVAALLVFCCGVTIDYYVPAVSPQHRTEQPMAAILLQAMTDAAQRGFAHWNWGGSQIGQETLQRFKAKWGGVRCEYRYVTTLNDRNLLQASPQALLEGYPGFFVVPFARLDEA